MALTATVTKKQVRKVINNLFGISMNMVLTDGEVEVINKDYTIRYRKGDVISEKINQLVNSMQDDIDKYKEESVLYNNAQLDTAVSSVQAALEV